MHCVVEDAAVKATLAHFSERDAELLDCLEVSWFLVNDIVAASTRAKRCFKLLVVVHVDR